jgi:hypothetical protein
MADCLAQKMAAKMAPEKVDYLVLGKKMAVQMAAMMAVQITKSKRSMVRTRTSN